jgi:hypothetical protein
MPLPSKCDLAVILGKIGETALLVMKDESTVPIKVLPIEEFTEFEYGSFDLDNSQLYLLADEPVLRPLSDTIKSVTYNGVSYTVKVRFVFEDAVLELY